MDNSLKIPATDTKTQEKSTLSRVSSVDVAGKITSHIGTGRNAKDSFIWMTITWSFYVAAVASFLFFCRSFFNVAAEDNLLDAVAKIWSIFIPIITLALGYAFGKGE